MKVQLKDIVASLEALKEVSKLKFKASKAFQIAKLVDSVSKEVSLYEQVRYQKVLEHSSDQKQVDQDKMPLFLEEMKSLLEKEVEVYDFQFEEADFENLDLSADHVLQLKWLMK